MSRIGNKLILVPDQAKVSVSGQQVKIEGPKGKLEFAVHPRIGVALTDNHLVVTRGGESRQDRSLHGMTRSILHSLVVGSVSGFQKRLEIHGVGFKAAVQGQQLNLSLGYSHPISYPIPADIKITVADATQILIEGADKHKVGQVAADIRAYYPPEPYKGKGVRFAGENIRRKEGKTAQSK
ncbi:MAG: 50S ribosomal protein L6 [Verrucomicrobiales bacterium]|jgi:large subunit ribosomal protein L6|nr:50S ribosomal protein L6 [Verrucomicrobiales bacterium]